MTFYEPPLPLVFVNVLSYLMTPFSFGLTILLWSGSKRSGYLLLSILFITFLLLRLLCQPNLQFDPTLQHIFLSNFARIFVKIHYFFQFETYLYKTYKEDVTLLLRFSQSLQLRILAPIIIKDNPKLNIISIWLKYRSSCI